MATVTVTSTQAGEEPTEEFYAETLDIALAVDKVIAEEKKVAVQDWIADVIFHCTQYFNAEGFSFVLTDNGGSETVTYRYVFTA